MSIKIIEKTISGNTYKNLKFSKTALPAEFIMAEKIYEEPITGENEYGTYYNYMFKVNKIKSMDPNTGQFTEMTDVGEASMFTTEKLHEQLKNVGTNVEFKLYKAIIEGPKGEYTKFEVDTGTGPISAPAAESTAKPAVEPWKDNATMLLNNKVDKEIIKGQIKRNYDVEDDAIDVFLDDFDNLN